MRNPRVEIMMYRHWRRFVVLGEIGKSSSSDHTVIAAGGEYQTRQEAEEVVRSLRRVAAAKKT